MKNANKLVGTVLAAAMFTTFLTPYANAAVAAKSPAPAASTKTTPSYVARVGYGQISKAEYSFFLMDAKSKVQQSLQTYDVDWKNQKIQNMAAGDFAKQIAMENAVTFKIQLVKAREAGMTLTKQEISQFYTDVNSYLANISPTAAKQEEYIKSQTGFTLSQFRGFYKNVYLANKFVASIKSNYKFTDSELKKYFDDNKDTFNKVTVGHILFMTQDSSGQALSQEKQDAAKKKAEDTLAKIKLPNADFAALVKELSEDPGSKDNGGEYTVQKNHQYVAEFEDWATDPTRKVGDTGIIKTSYGYHVMKMNKIFSFDELKQDLVSGLTTKKYESDLASWKNDKNCKLINNKAVYDAIIVS